MPTASLTRRGEKVFRRLLGMLPPECATLAKGLASYVPGIFNFVAPTDSISAQYCYSVWLEHLILANDSGLSTPPGVIVELGPGSSLGVGLAAMLCGVDKYFALDTIRHARAATNVDVLIELCELFRSRACLGLHKGDLESLSPFPRHLVTGELLRKSMEPSRIEFIKQALKAALETDRSGRKGQIEIAYFAPWNGVGTLEPNSVDMVTSTVVLQTVMDLSHIYSCCSTWLKPGGFMSHLVDYSNYGMAREWNGHWGYSSGMWRLMQGNRPYLHNRAPHSRHIQLMLQNGFEVVCEERARDYSGMKKTKLAREFKDISDDDFTTRGARIVAIKR